MVDLFKTFRFVKPPGHSKKDGVKFAVLDKVTANLS